MSHNPTFHDISEAPKDGRTIEVRYAMSGMWRWKPYKPGSSQLRLGVAGRWQKHDGFGWRNADLPRAGMWFYVSEADTE